jgi:hypothetical protein
MNTANTVVGVKIAAMEGFWSMSVLKQRVAGASKEGRFPGAVQPPQGKERANDVTQAL